MSSPMDGARRAQRIAVVGSGASGLAAAFDLLRSGYEVEVFESADIAGGRFGAATFGDRQVMLGGKNIGRKYTSFRGFTSAMGHNPYVPFGINASRVKDGRVLTLDSSRMARSLGHFAQLGSAADIARLVVLALRIRSNPANGFLDSPLFRTISRKHDATPLSDHFGPQVTRQLLKPMTVRTNGAEPDEVYYGTFGTNLNMLLDTYDQLEFGIQPVLDEFAKQVTVRLNSTVEGLLTSGGVVTGVRVSEDGGAPQDLPFDGVVLATPAYATAELVADVQPLLAKRLREVNYFPSTVVLVEYDRPFFNSDVRALAMDDGPCSNAGSYGKDDRHIVRYTFSGRHGRILDADPEQIDRWVDETEAKVSGYLGITAGTRVRTMVKHWKAAYCGYLAHHPDFLNDVHGMVANLPGLELAGDYLVSVSIEGCFRSGTAAAQRLSAYLGSVDA